MANRLEGVDESFASRLKEEMVKTLVASGLSDEDCKRILEKALTPTAPDWDRIAAPRFADREIIPARIDPNRPLVNLYLSDEERDVTKKLIQSGNWNNVPENVAAPFHEFVDKHPDAIARLSPDEFQLLGLLFKTKGGESVISLYNQAKQ